MLRFIQGSLGGAGVVIARAVVRDLFRGAAAARVFALLMLVTGVAPVFAPLVGGQALAITSWRGIFIVLAAIGVPLLARDGAVAAGDAAARAPARRRARHALRTFRRLLSDRSFMPPAAAFSLAFAAMFAYIAGASFVLEDVFGVSPQVFSVVFAVNSVGLIAASQLGGRVVGRVGAPALLRVRACSASRSGSIGVLVVRSSHAGLAPLLIGLFVILSFERPRLPERHRRRARATRRVRSAARRRCSAWVSSESAR